MKVSIAAMLSALVRTGGAEISPARRAECAKRAAELVAKLSAEERIGQLMIDSPEVARLGIPKCHWWNAALAASDPDGARLRGPSDLGRSFRDCRLCKF